jgi:hypothetical protein
MCLQAIQTHQSKKSRLSSSTGTKKDKRRHSDGSALAVQDQVEDDGQRQGQHQGEEHGPDGRAEAPCEPFSSGIHVDRYVCRYMSCRDQVVERKLFKVLTGPNSRSQSPIALLLFPHRGPNTHLPKPGAFPDTTIHLCTTLI